MSGVPGLQEQFDRMTGRDRFGREWPPPGVRMSSSTPNLDKMTEHAAEATAVRSFVQWLKAECQQVELDAILHDLDGLLAEWIGVDPRALEEEKRWVARQQQRAAQRSREEK